jgi:hypothetical protein
MMIFIAQFPLPAIARLPESTACLDKLTIRKARIPVHAAEFPMMARLDKPILTIFISQVLSLDIFQQDQDFSIMFLTSGMTSSA